MSWREDVRQDLDAVKSKADIANLRTATVLDRLDRIERKVDAIARQFQPEVVSSPCPECGKPDAKTATLDAPLVRALKKQK